MELNEEQRKLVEAEPKGVALIKGIAGSGKTTVALHRALFLHRQYCINDDRVLLATFNRTLINYLQYIYQGIAEKYKEGYANLFSSSQDRVDIMTIDQIIFHYYNENLQEESIKPLYNNTIANQTIMECIRDLPKQYQSFNFLGDSVFLQDEISWIKSCGIRDVEEYQTVDRIGRTRPQGDDAPQRLPKKSEARQVIFNTMIDYDRKLEEQGYIHPREMAARCLAHAKVNPSNKYRHIIIDEGQDLTRVQLEFLQTLFSDVKGCSFTLIMDIAQSIYSGAWLVKGHSLASVGLDVTGRSSSLSKNYRTSTQVSQAAYSLLEKDSNITETEGFVPPSLLDRQGDYPVLKVFKSENEEARQTLALVKSLLKKGASYTDIAIIARMKKQLNQTKDTLEAAGIPTVQVSPMKSGFEHNAVRLMTMHAVKGLEYPFVMIVGLNNEVIPYLRPNQSNHEYQEANERKLLYVGMTRSLDQLYMSCWGEPSRFLGDINPAYFRISPGSIMRGFRKINVDDYLFKAEIRDIYSSEEEIRQWVIKELTHTYSYPLDLIEVEFKVSLFSRPGSIDVVVNTYQQGNYSPFIVVEVKAPGSDLVQGLEQLKSYMSVLPTCQYGLLTNGNEIVVVNKNIEPVEDIPAFKFTMMPVDSITHRYIDFASKREYLIHLDSDVTDRIVLESDQEVLDYAGDQVVKVPVYSKAAAGEACLMEEHADGYFCLPSKWLAGKQLVYLLKVKGDSMIGANINDGDLVLVEAGTAFKVRDIVVVAFGDESVIKRFVTMGGTALLMSENEKYEPIQISSSDQAQVLGVVKGVINTR